MHNCGIRFDELQAVRAAETSKVPMAPMGKLLTRSLRLACTTAADALVNYSAMFTDVYVLQRSEISHCPDGKNTDVLALILACTTAANASVIFSMYVPQRTLKTSHRPDGIFTCLALACACRAAVSWFGVAR